MAVAQVVVGNVNNKHMLQNIQLKNILVLDIETVSQQSNYSELDDEWQELWNKKTNLLNTQEKTPSQVYDRAAIYAEFGKIVCIGLGVFYAENEETKLKVKAISGDNEKEILEEFAHLLNTKFNTSNHILAAHNGKEFDFPFICRRMLINGIQIPAILDIAGKKPWEINHLDTMELWKFGDYKNYTSLNVLAKCFGIPSPKDDIDGSLVGYTYWQQNDLERIVTYCKKDIVTTAQIIMKYKGVSLIANNNITIE